MFVVVGLCWLLLVVVGCCWLSLVAVGYCRFLAILLVEVAALHQLSHLHGLQLPDAAGVAAAPKAVGVAVAAGVAVAVAERVLLSHLPARSSSNLQGKKPWSVIVGVSVAVLLLLLVFDSATAA